MTKKSWKDILKPFLEEEKMGGLDMLMASNKASSLLVQYMEAPSIKDLASILVVLDRWHKAIPSQAPGSGFSEQMDPGIYLMLSARLEKKRGWSKAILDLRGAEYVLNSDPGYLKIIRFQNKVMQPPILENRYVLKKLWKKALEMAKKESGGPPQKKMERLSMLWDAGIDKIVLLDDNVKNVLIHLDNYDSPLISPCFKAVVMESQLSGYLSEKEENPRCNKMKSKITF